MPFGSGRTFASSRCYWCFLMIAMLSLSGRPAWALIFGAEGNNPITDPGWPKGAAAVFNTEFRVAYWEGPPFGGGQYHAECRGDHVKLQRVLDDFAKIDTPFKRVVLHDGVGRSFWLNPNGEQANVEKAKIDWVFMVWQPERRQIQRRLPVGMSAVGKRDPTILAQLDVYTGGSIQWKNVTVPEGVDVVDQRLESHGFTVEDGTVLEGKVIDVATNKPIKASLMLLKIEPQPTGGYLYPKSAEVDTDAEGRWVLKKAPAGRFQLVLMADGYVSRVIGYGNYDDQPQWTEHNSGLSTPGQVTGRVVDQQGNPLVDAEVRIDDIDVKNVGGYELPDRSAIKTDHEGRFAFDSLPIGTATVRVDKPGFVRPGLGEKIAIPTADLKLEMQASAKLRVTVDFSATKQAGNYLVQIVPEGGEKVGKWSGSGNIDATNVITFENIPAGPYVVSGMPNPGSSDQKTDPMNLDLKGGETKELTIKAK